MLNNRRMECGKKSGQYLDYTLISRNHIFWPSFSNIRMIQGKKKISEKRQQFSLVFLVNVRIADFFFLFFVKMAQNVASVFGVLLSVHFKNSIEFT